MFEFNRRQITPDSSGLQRHSSRTYTEQAHRAAHGSYHRARMRGSLRWLWAAATGRSGHLLDLERMTASCIIRGQHAAGSQAVLLSQIVGSEGRAQEFDSTFAPLKNHTKQRWITIATMMELGEALPLVTLVQIGDNYFVRDGHHRVSVARALGYAYIDANVTVWDVVDTAACGCRSAAQQLA
jgi:hypothetical protein